MKTVNIDFTKEMLGIIAREGEYNRTELVFSLDEDLQDCDFINVVFGTNDNLEDDENPTIENLQPDEGGTTLTIKLVQDMTVRGMLYMQLVGYVVDSVTAEPQVIVKSPVVSGVVTPSLKGKKKVSDSSPSLLDRIWAKIEAWASKIHEHGNKTILDGFTSFADNQFYNGLDKYDLNWKYGKLRFVGDGAVVKEIKEIERDGKKYLRLYLHWSNGVIIEGQSDFIDIPVNAVTQIEEENPGFDFTLNGGALELPSGGEGVAIHAVHTLPTEASDGDMCLYSPANVIELCDSGKRIYFDWEEFAKPVSEQSRVAYSIRPPDNKGSLTIDCQTSANGSNVTIQKNTPNPTTQVLLRVVFSNGTLSQGILQTTVDGVVEKTEFTSVDDLPKCFDLFEFDEIANNQITGTATAFYAPYRLMVYRAGEWQRVETLLDVEAGLTEEQAADLAANTAARHEHPDELRLKKDGKVIASYEVTDEQIVLHLDAEENESGLINPEDVIIPLGSGEDVNAEIWDAIEDLQNTIGYTTKEVLEPLEIAETNTTYTLNENLLTLDVTTSGQIPRTYFSNKVIDLKYTTPSGYMIFAKCTNGYVIMNGGQKFFYIPNSATASNQATGISALHIGEPIAEPVRLTIFDDNNITIVGDIIDYNLTNTNFATYLKDAGITDTFEKFVLGFARDPNSDATMQYSTVNTVIVTEEVENKPLADKKISIIGDSISTFNGYIPSGYATHYPKETITDVSQTWWHLLCAETGAELLVNASYSGSYVTGESTSTTDALAACSDKRIADLANGTDTPDIVICYIGINDFGQNAHRELGDYIGQTTIPNEGTITTFSDGYALMIKKIMSAYPNAKVYCCSLLETKTENWDTDENGTFPCINNNGVALASFNERIKTLCSALGAEFIDLHACGINYWNLDSYTHDGLHPNADGAKLMKEKIKSKLLADYQ